MTGNADKSGRWEFPPRLRNRLALTKPENDAQLNALIGRLKDGELWLAAAIERRLN
jgi:ribosome assembly protein YihI (activator of Der GTPase)